MRFNRPHHQKIDELLHCFDPDFLRQNNILFGGGTRISIELNEFRESVDIDLFCIGQNAYRAARSSVNNISFGQLLKQGCELERYAGREIRADRRCYKGYSCGSSKPKQKHMRNDVAACWGYYKLK